MTWARRYGLDLLILVAALEGALEVGLRTKDPASAAAALVVLPLLARRRFPFAAPVSLWVLAAGLSFADGRLIVLSAGINVAGLVSAFLLGNLRDELEGRVGLAVVVVGAVVVMYNDPDRATGDVFLIPAVFAIAWLAGFAQRERAEQAEAAEERARQAEREREAAARVAVAEERTRIARELHDVVAHAVSVMVLQVGAVRHRLPAERAEDAEALAGVERTGRTALTEMRQLLGAMRATEEEAELAPQPGLAALEALVENTRRAGLAVRVHVDGEPVALPGALDLSAYRIVQEGLTNTLKHAHATHADVVIRYAPEELRIEVRDDGRGERAGAGAGHGLAGIRERVKIYGGEMTAATRNGGGFVLSTRLPLTGYRP